MTPKWTWDDLRIIGDIVMGSILASGLRLIVIKAFLEPAAVFIGQRAYRRVDDLTGDRLPDLFKSPPSKTSGQ